MVLNRLDIYEKIPVVQLSFQGDKISRYGSVREAADTLKIKKELISAAVCGRTYSAGGYLFVREEYYNPLNKITLQLLKFKRKLRKMLWLKKQLVEKRLKSL